MILGTAAHVSPEQARGQSGDHRSDVFSFGVVFYEMLTGLPPFQGDTVSDVLASVLARDPDFARVPANLLPRLVALVKRWPREDAEAGLAGDGRSPARARRDRREPGPALGDERRAVRHP